VLRTVLGLFACFNIQDTAEGYVVNKTYCNCTCESADSRQRKEKYKRNEKRWRALRICLKNRN